MIISIKRNWSLAEVHHKAFLTKLLSKYFLDCKSGKVKYLLCYDFLRRNHKYITSNKREDYIKSIISFNDEIKKGSNTPDFEKNFKSEIKKIINYDSFARKTGNYNAYVLCFRSAARTCPYCNQSYAFSVQRHSRGFRPTLDHYYDKASYPHLALSLYNLIPSCYSCNSSLKGKRDFFKNQHLHPFFDDECFSFSIANKDSSFSNPDELILKEIETLSIMLSSKNEVEKNSLDTFLLNERYESFISDALVFAQNKRAFDDIKLNDQIFITRQMKEETSLRFNKNNYKNEMLGKMFLDIYNQFKQD